MVKPGKTGKLPLMVTDVSGQKSANAIRFLLPALVILGMLLAWYLISFANLFPAYALPSPEQSEKFQEEIRAGRLINDVIALSGG
jgi:ABC-type nitrate/sulfonate/bicarbonate transport system permease component